MNLPTADFIFYSLNSLGYGLTPLEPFRAISTTDCQIAGKCITGTSNVMRMNYGVGPGNCVGVSSIIGPNKKGHYAVPSSLRTRQNVDTGHYNSYGASAYLVMVSHSTQKSENIY